MRTERRSEGNQVPDNQDEILNKAQLYTLNKLEGYGWTLAFIRRPLFQDIVTILSHSESQKVGILEEDGSINLQPNIDFRR